MSSSSFHTIKLNLSLKRNAQVFPFLCSKANIQVAVFFVVQVKNKGIVVGNTQNTLSASQFCQTCISQSDRNSSYFHQEKNKQLFSCFVQFRCFLWERMASAPINRALMTALPLVSISSGFVPTIPHKTGTPG